jgi:hypothetical protein
LYAWDIYPQTHSSTILHKSTIFSERDITGGVVTEEQLANIDSVTQNWYILHDIFEIEEINPSDYLTTEDFKLMTYASLSGSTITGLSESAYNAIIAAGPKMAALVEKLEAEIEEREAKD